MDQLIHFLHPLPIATRVVGHLPLPELALMVWEFHRGGVKPHFKNCKLCNSFIKMCIDEMWKKWDHEAYEDFGCFIFLLTKRKRFDTFCKNIKTKNNKIKHFYTYFEGYAPGIVTFI